MRKDVQKLQEMYPRRTGDDLVRLGWPPKPADMAARFSTLLSSIDFNSYSKDRRLKLLDIGCGLGLLLDYLAANDLLDRVDYTGVDLVDEILATVRDRWPNHQFEKRDVRDAPFAEGAFDYCVICGIFTESRAGNAQSSVAFGEARAVVQLNVETRRLGARRLVSLAARRHHGFLQA
jgi:SAM-dependent methyltransferase